jgi:lipopolysaccharide transport system ATP-binding protein
VEKFIDTPVKRYSSGMYVRLAFAVAAHLEPEILIVDEVLSVGDAEFQKKCLGKMHDFSHGGARTVLFVSHNMNAVTRLCDRAVLLVNGLIEADGPTSEVMELYISSSGGDTADLRSGFVPASAKTKKNDGGDVILLSASLQSSSGQQKATFLHEDEIVISLRYRLRRPVKYLRIGFRLLAKDGTVILTSGNTDNSLIEHSDSGVYLSTCRIPSRFLNKGDYFLTLTSDVPWVKVNYSYERALCFSVQSSVIDDYRGPICTLLPWATITDTGREVIDDRASCCDDAAR